MYIMVLNDGETYTDLEGCYIAKVPNACDTEEIEDMLKDLKLDEDLRDEVCVVSFQAQWR